MIGIYKIINKINGKCYIGQSTQIEKRWSKHKNTSHNQTSKAYDYPLYRAFRKYGIENFSFKILEECSNLELNEKEKYWINYYNPEYNQTTGGDYKTVPKKLTYEQVQKIQKILIEDQDGNISHIELAKKYNIHTNTIRDINVGRTWKNSSLQYPLHISKYDSARHLIEKKYCIDCGKEISHNAIRCIKCNGLLRQKKTAMLISREELKKLIRTTPFTTIGKQYGVTDNAVRKWCDKYNLPRKVKEIKSYSDEEWELI